MAPLFDALIAQLRKSNLLDMVDDIVPMFEVVIDVSATVRLHAESFAEVTNYMENYMSAYSILFEDSEMLWVPLDLVKYVFRDDKSFRFRLSRFIKSLTDQHYRTEDDDLLFDLNMGNIGNAFMSWDMVLVLMVQEGVVKEAESQKGKEKAKPMETIQEAVPDEDDVTDQWEASMALVALQEDLGTEVPDESIEGDKILEEAPELAIVALHPVIIDGKEFLFLDDIAKKLGLREDETLSIVATSVGVSKADKNKIAISFEDDSLTKALTYDVGSSSLQDTVAKALLEIKHDVDFYESVPDSAFEPPTPLTASATKDQGSIDLTKGQLVQIDDATETAFEVDKFAMRIGGGSRPKSEGRDASLWHYLPSLRADVIRVVHLDYAETAHAEILKCRALSAVLSEDPLASNINKCILINREAAMYCFAGKHPGSILGHCALSQAQGIQEPSVIVESLGHKTASKSLSVEVFQELMKKI